MKPHIVGISETWLDDCDHFSGIAGYNFLHKPLALLSTKNYHSLPPCQRSIWPVAGIESFCLVQHRKSEIYGPSRQIWQIWLVENTKRMICANSKNRFRPEISNPKGLWDLDLNYKEGPDLAFPVDGSAESLLVEINNTKEKECNCWHCLSTTRLKLKWIPVWLRPSIGKILPRKMSLYFKWVIRI